MRPLALILLLTLGLPAVHRHQASRGQHATECARSIVVYGLRNSYHCSRANPEARTTAIAEMSRITHDAQAAAGPY